MKIFRLTAVLAIALPCVTACVQTTPLISHAHIGHAMTTWHDTPDQQGLFVVAGKELDIAIQSSERALQSYPNAAAVQRHLADTLHALNPDRQRLGPGLDYGAIRALTGALEHLEYAARSDDASSNFVSSVVTLVDQGDLVIGRMQEAEQQIVAKSDAMAYARDEVLQIRDLLVAAKYGNHGDGHSAAPADESWIRVDGLNSIAATIDDMLRRETDPSYQPVSKKYVLGLVRLPNGVWAYRLPRRERESVGYGY